MSHPTSVVNVRRFGRVAGHVPIGRGTLFGNPIVRGRACPWCSELHRRPGSDLHCYRRYLARRLAREPWFRRQVAGLHGRVLACSCKPAPCHGDVLAQVAAALRRGGMAAAYQVLGVAAPYAP